MLCEERCSPCHLRPANRPALPGAPHVKALCLSSRRPCLVTMLVLDLRSWVEEVTDATMPPCESACGLGWGGLGAEAVCGWRR